MSYWSDLTSDVTLLGHLIKLTSPMNLAACLHPGNWNFPTHVQTAN